MATRKDTHLTQTGVEVQELLDQVENKSIYPNATTSVAGLMSADDKEKLDDAPNRALTNLEIEAILNS